MLVGGGHSFYQIPAHAALARHVLLYNLIFPTDNLFCEDYTLLPNACGTISLAFDGNELSIELWGAASAPVHLGAEPNRYRTLLLIQLLPAGLYQITRLNQASLTDHRLRLEDVDRALFCALRQAFMASRTVSELAHACNAALLRRMERPVVADAVLLAVSAICARHGQIRMCDVSRQTGYSARHLDRLFLSQIGTTPKHYARLVRFHHALAQMQGAPACLAALSQQAGFFDQAHFDKDFKAISGVSPLDFRQNMSDFYYDTTRISPILCAKGE